MWTLLDLTVGVLKFWRSNFGEAQKTHSFFTSFWNLCFKVDPANPPPLIAPETQEPVPLMVAAVASWVEGTFPSFFDGDDRRLIRTFLHVFRWVGGSHLPSHFSPKRVAFEEPSAIGHRLVTMEVSKSFKKKRAAEMWFWEPSWIDWMILGWG